MSLNETSPSRADAVLQTSSTSASTEPLAPPAPIRSLCDLPDVGALARSADTARALAAVRCPALSAATHSAVLGPGAAAGSLIERTTFTPDAVLCWRPALVVIPSDYAAQAFSSIVSNATRLSELLQLDSSGNATGTSLGDVCWTGCSSVVARVGLAVNGTPPLSAADAALLLSAPSPSGTAAQLGPSLLICDADGTWQPALPFASNTASTAQALWTQPLSTAVTVDCGLSASWRANGRWSLFTGDYLGAVNTPPVPPFPSRCYPAIPSNPPVITRAVLCGSTALLQWWPAMGVAWADRDASATTLGTANYSQFISPGSKPPTWWGAGSSVEAVAQVAALGNIAALPTAYYTVMLAALVRPLAEQPVSLAASAFGGASVMELLSSSVFPVELQPAEPVAPAQVSVAIGAVTLATVADAAFRSTRAQLSAVWNLTAAKATLVARLLVAYGSIHHLGGLPVTVSVVVTGAGSAGNSGELNMTTGFALAVAGVSVSSPFDSSSELTGSCAFASAELDFPPLALADTRYSRLVGSAQASSLALPEVDAAAVSQLTPASALILSDALPAGVFRILLPTPPVATEAVLLNCSATGELEGAVVVEPPLVLAHAAAWTSSARSGVFSFSARASFVRKPFRIGCAGSQDIVPEAGLVSGSVLCSITSQTALVGGAQMLSVYAGVSPVVIPIKLLAASWPLFTDAVVDDNSTMLRSAWGMSSTVSSGARVQQPAGSLLAPLSSMSQTDAAAAAIRYALPAASDRSFSLSLSGRTSVTLVADVWQWRDAGAVAMVAATGVSGFLSQTCAANASSGRRNLQTDNASRGAPVLVDRRIAFLSGVRVFIGSVECTVQAVTVDGTSVRILSPSYAEVCGQAPEQEAASPCGAKSLVIVNPSLLTPAHLRVLATGGRDAIALEAAINGAGALRGFPLLGAAIACPPFCPGAGGGALPSTVQLAAATGAAATQVIILPAAALSGASGSGLSSSGGATVTTESPSAASAGGAGGLAYVVECSSPRYNPASPLDYCLNYTHPDSRRCGFGSADTCRDCPRLAVCPGSGFRAWPIAGAWSSSERSPAVVACAVPASRCLGFDDYAGSSMCAPGYRQSSFACSVCALDYFPDPRGSGACIACPTDITLWTSLQPVLEFLGGLAAMGVAMAVFVVIVSRRNGGTVVGGLKRTVQFVLSIVAVLQVAIQIGRAACPGLPALLRQVYRFLFMLQFQGITLHPNCVHSPPFQNEYVQMGISLSLVLTATLLFLNFRRLCGVGARKETVLRGRFRSHRATAVEAKRSNSPVRKKVSGQSNVQPQIDACELQANPLSRSRVVAAASTDAAESCAQTPTVPSTYGGRLMLCCTLVGTHVETTKPLLRRVVFTLLTVLYATVTNSILSLVKCSDVLLTAGAYAALDADGSTSQRQLGLGLVSIASPCADDTCSARNVNYDRLLTVSVLDANSGFVCYEASHLLPAVLAWVGVALYSVGYPLFTLLLVRRRIWQIMRRGPLRQAFDSALQRDHARRREWARTRGCGGLLPLRWCGARLCLLGSRHLPTDGDVRANAGVLGCVVRFCSAMPRVYPSEAPPATPTSLSSALPPLPSKCEILRPAAVDATRAQRASTHALAAHKTRIAHLYSAGYGGTLPQKQRRPDSSVAPVPTISRRSAPSALAGEDNMAGVPGIPQVQPCPRGMASRGVAARDAVAPGGIGYVLTANGLIDTNVAIVQNASLSHFTSADYRASRFWMRHVDFALLLVLAVLIVFWPSSGVDAGGQGGKLVITLAALAVEAIAIVACKPYTPDNQWLFVVKLSSLLLAGCGALLNFVNSLTPVQAAEGSADEPERPLSVVVLSYLSFCLCCFVLASVVVAFMLALTWGASSERVELQRVQAARQAAATHEASLRNTNAPQPGGPGLGRASPAVTSLSAGSASSMDSRVAFQAVVSRRSVAAMEAAKPATRRAGHLAGGRVKQQFTPLGESQHGVKATSRASPVHDFHDAERTRSTGFDEALVAATAAIRKAHEAPAVEEPVSLLLRIRGSGVGFRVSSLSSNSETASATAQDYLASALGPPH